MHQDAMTTAPPAEWVADAYAYLLGRYLVIRQESKDSAEAGFGYNRVKYNPLGSAEFVNPNLDVAYLEAWFAVDDRTPVIVEVPQITDRYYTAQILDEWGEVIVNINERATPATPHGRFALCLPGSTPGLPAGVIPIYLHSAKAKMLARVELRSDTERAVELQHQFAVSGGSTSVQDPPAIADFDNGGLVGVKIFDNLDAVLASALDVSPCAPDLQLKARAIALLRAQVIPEFQRWAATHMGQTRNRWMGGSQTGNYGDDYRLRTAANLIGIWANTSSEALYFQAAREEDGSPLDGSNSYRIHFPADALPDTVVHAYWSVILVSVPDYRVVPNRLERYNLNAHSTLQYEPDGSLMLGVGPDPVRGVPESNWLPSAPGKPFTLTFRAYVPDHSISPPHGSWAPPPLTRVTEEAQRSR